MSTTPSTLEYVLSLLQRMVDGEELTVPGLLREDDCPVESAALRRYLAALSQLSLVEVETAKRTKAYWASWPTDQNSTPQEILALRAARSMLSTLRDSSLHDALDDILLAHQRRLPGTLPHDLSRVFVARNRMMSPLGISSAMIDRIVDAISKTTTVSFGYQLYEGGAYHYFVAPLSVVFGDEGVYLYGDVQAHDEATCPVRHMGRRQMFHLARINDLKQTKELFLYPERDGYDVNELWRHCFGIFLPQEGEQPSTVRLRFEPRWRAYLEGHRWHPSQTAPVLGSDGSVEISLCVHPTYDVVRWIRGFGREVQVLEPESRHSPNVCVTKTLSKRRVDGL